MSGELISTARGKIPQRAIRHIDELPYAVTYDIVESASVYGVDFDGSNIASILATPASRRAKCIEVQIYDTSEAFVDDTTPGYVAIGDGSDIDEFGRTDDIVDGLAGQVFTSYDGTFGSADFDIIEAGDQVTVTCVAGTGTLAAGIAKVAVTFLYFQ
jgi:hypothetical protein